MSNHIINAAFIFPCSSVANAFNVLTTPAINSANTEVTWRLHCKDLKSRMYGISVRYEGLTDGQCKREQI